MGSTKEAGKAQGGKADAHRVVGGVAKPAKPTKAPKGGVSKAAKEGEKGAAEPSKGTVKAPGGTTKISVDIDDIFASGKKKQQQQKEVATSAGEGGQGQEGKPRPAKVKGSKDDLFGEGGAEVRGRTEEGFPIYKEGDLKINMPGSGETPLCPFDCECCF